MGGKVLKEGKEGKELAPGTIHAASENRLTEEVRLLSL